jgi:hypothetical protein
MKQLAGMDRDSNVEVRVELKGLIPDSERPVFGNLHGTFRGTAKGKRPASKAAQAR